MELLLNYPLVKTAENRHAILEEFTSLYYTFCPDGHKAGNDIANANPTTYHRIHIHAGGFAQAQAGDPDMATTEGTAIDNIGNLGGSYPFTGKK